MFDRRTLLQVLSAAALAGCGPSEERAQGQRIIVVGAGIVGASIAYHLAKAGASVTVIEKIAPAMQASRGTFAWINATWAKQPRDYHALNQAGVSSWEGLQAELGIPVKWGGSLEWFGTEERQRRLDEQIAEQAAWGEPATMLGGGALAELEPNVDFSTASRAAYSPNDGAVNPVAATLALLKGAEGLGTRIKYPCTLESISEVSGGGLVAKTSLGDISAEKVVLATGAAEGMADTFAGVRVPQRSTPGVIAITKPMSPVLNRIIAAPGAHMHQRPDGRIVLGEQTGAPDTPAHDMRLEDRPTSFPTEAFALQHFERIRGEAARFLPALENAEAEHVHIGWRPLPLDGHPALGFSPSRPSIYVAIMHSGVSLAPIVGQLVSQEVISGALNDRLADYRPTRTFSNLKRY